jgi:hypothetical protein
MSDAGARCDHGKVAACSRLSNVESTGTEEKLPLDEIWRRYPNEWVVLIDTDWDGVQETAGVVYAHSLSRKEAGTLASGLRNCAIF